MKLSHLTLLLFFRQSLCNQIRILPHGKVRPMYKVQCLAEFPELDILPQDEVSNVTVVWRDTDANTIVEHPVNIGKTEEGVGYLGSEMGVLFASASSQFSCAFKRPNGRTIFGITQYNEIYVHAKTDRCESELQYCDPGKVCRQAKCVCQQGEHLLDGNQCIPGMMGPPPCQVVTAHNMESCRGALKKVAVRSPYKKCKPKKKNGFVETIQSQIYRLTKNDAAYRNCPCEGSTSSNVLEIEGDMFCQDVELMMCCVPLALLPDTHDFSLVWFTLISISIFIGLVLIAAFVLMVCKSRSTLQAHHRAQLRAMAMHQHEEHFTIYDPRLTRAISVGASDKPPSYSEVVQRETSTPPPAYNVAIANISAATASSENPDEGSLQEVSTEPKDEPVSSPPVPATK